MTTMSFNSVYIYLFIYFVDHNLKMATYLRLLSVLLALSIVGDILHIKDVWFDGGEENGNSLGKLKYSLPLPGAESYAKSYAGLSSASLSWTKKLAKAVAKKKGDGSDKSTFGLTKSAIKAAKKLAKVTAKKIGDARNKRRRRRGLSIF
jgi:hypothetical protein